MDFRQLFSDDALKSEFLERIGEIAANSDTANGLEGLEGGISPDVIEAAAESMAEGRWSSSDPGLEAIILRFVRPVYLRKACLSSTAGEFSATRRPLTK